MNPNPKLRSIAVAALLLSGTLVVAEQIQAHRAVDILRGKGSMYLPPLATAKDGDQINVLAHEGRWLRVQYGSIQGYALEAALTGDGPSAGSSGVSSPSAASGSNDANAATAAKGWDHVTWANSHGYSLAGLQQMKATRAALQSDPSTWEQFKSSGNVGAK